MSWLDPKAGAESWSHFAVVLNALATRHINWCPVCGESFEDGEVWLEHLGGAHTTTAFERVVDEFVLTRQGRLLENEL